jgi:PAS domain S-box-containing protein
VDVNPSRQFTASDVRLLELFAQQSAIAVEKARLIDESRRQTQELAALYDTALAVGGVLEIEELLARLHRQVQALMNPASFEVVLFHDDAQEIQIMLAMAANEPVRNVIGMRAPLDEAGLTGWVIRTRKPFLVRDLQTEQLPVEPGHITQPARSWLGVPLIAREHLIGVISVQSFRPDAFDAGDRRLLESLSAQVAIAIENAQLYEVQRRQADELARLHRASATLFLPATTDLPSVAQNIVEAILREFDQANCSLLLLDPDTDELQRVGAAGPYVSQVTQARLTLDGRGLVPLAARSRQIVNVPDVSVNPNYVENWDQARSEMAVPLKVGDRVIGVLDVQSNERAAFGRNEERLLTTFAERAALALENALLYQETAKRAEEMASLYAVGLATVSSLSLDDVLATIYEQCRWVVPCETFYVALHRPGEKFISFPIFIHHGKRIKVDELDFNSSDGFTAYIIRQRTALVLDAKSAYEDNTPVRPVMMADPPSDTYVGVPLLFRGDIIGVLSVQSSDPAAYHEDHVRLLATIAAQAAIAIENARYYEAIQDYADSLQRAAHEKEQLLEQVQRHAETLELEVAARTAEIFAEKVKTEAVLKSAGDAIVLTGADCYITYVNDAFIELTGYASEEAVDRHIQELFDTAQVPGATRADLEKALAEGGPWRGDVLTVCRNHQLVETEMTLAPVRDADGRILSFVGSLRDVSQTRALERAKSEFLANVSHQLRTPISNLKTYSFLLSNGSQEKQARYIDIVGTEVDKLTHLVQDVLEIAELDVGPIVADWQPVWPTELVSSIVQGYEARAEALGLKLRAELPVQPLPPVLGSPLRLGQALNQIVENALLYTVDGEIVVGGRLDNTGASARPEVVIWVSDTGPGIPSEEQKFLFDRFFRGKAAEPGHIVGTGLGLAVASLIIEAHRGQIEVQSALGEGSTISVRLPIPD